MAAIDELISTYLTACEVQGKTANTVTADRATLRDFRRAVRLTKRRGARRG